MTTHVLFGGKGGVGKTTCAAATALSLAKEGKKVLIVSTDPAHSLSDSYEKGIGSKEKEIFPNLKAVEIDPKENVEQLKEELGPGGMPEMPESPMGGMMGMNPAEMLGGMDMTSMPGMDEAAALKKFLEYMDSTDFDYIVFDTAPTGHMLKFLGLPETLDSWVGKMLKIKMKLSGMMDAFKGLMPFSEKKEKPGEKPLDKLEELKKKIRRGREILTNPEKTEFNLVMIPAEMSISESERAREALDEFGIAVQRVIVNQVQPAGEDCDFCNARRKLHEKKISEIEEKFKDLEIKIIPLRKVEIKGKERLLEFSKKL